jgi:hypothetical protein
MRRLASILVPLLIVTQLLLAIPASGLARAAAGSAMGHEDPHCPCCPAGANSMTDCLVGCTLATAIAPSASYGRVISISRAEFGDPVASFDTRSDPPLKPPPIA